MTKYDAEKKLPKRCSNTCSWWGYDTPDLMGKAIRFCMVCKWIVSDDLAAKWNLEKRERIIKDNPDRAKYKTEKETWSINNSKGESVSE